MKINSYRFGEIVIDGVTYRSDVIVLPDRVRAEWWRREGHCLHIVDLEEVLEAEPELLIVGQGFYGRMSVPSELSEELGRRGIRIVAGDTWQACETFNSVPAGKRAAAALHLTC
jgi:hypothetical protein